MGIWYDLEVYSDEHRIFGGRLPAQADRTGRFPEQHGIPAEDGVFRKKEGGTE
jgi:hypothetical protein